ncbi:MAG: tRNA (adenosine(37)-N6)-dimethylallyltransferase MiaA [Rikenellaceae bacterium]
MSTKLTLIVIVGPTGCGKTDFSIKLAQRLSAPIISTDSRQFFKGLAIGSAQPDSEQLAAVNHYFIADRELGDVQNCGNYEREALALLEGLFAENQYVIAVGGSGLYIDALCDGMDSFEDVDPEIRSELKAKSIEELRELLEQKDPEYYAKVDKNNRQRLIRALEICLQTGKTYSSQRHGTRHKRDFDIIKIGLTMDRAKLYERINLRVDMMLEQGLESEARAVLPFRELNSLQTVGYREMFEYFDGAISLERATELIKQNSRRYAKRQMTWFNRDERITWFTPHDFDKVCEYIDSKVKS